MNRRIKKFWLICASVVGAGFILFIVGYLTGGVESMDKLSDKYSWINVPSEERISEKLQGEEFSSIQLDGYADVQIYQGEETFATAYYSDDMTRPEMYVENGVLKIDVKDEAKDGVYVNLGSSGYPLIEISCADIDFESIDVRSHHGDIKVEHVNAENMSLISETGDIDVTACETGRMNVESDYGDIVCSDVSSGAFSAKLDTGDITFYGSLSGAVDIQSDVGDVDVVTDAGEDMYSVVADVDTGDFSVNGESYSGKDGRYQYGNGAYVIKITCDTGDVSVEFAD